MADYEINRRLKYLIKEVFKMSPFAFSQKYNDNGGVKTSQVIRERNGLSMQLLENIIEAYPEISRTWLLTGEGEMLKNAKPKEEVITTDSVVIPNDVWEVIKNQAESLKTKDQQTSKVIEMLEEQLKKSQRVQAQFRAANLVVVEDE